MNILATARERFGSDGTASKPDIEAFETLWRETCAEIADRYRPGCGEFIKQCHPETRRQLDEAWDAANEFWAQDIERFRDKIERWKSLWSQAIRIFKEYHSGDTADGPEPERHSLVQSTFPGFEGEARSSAQPMGNAGHRPTVVKEG
jgi:hypothetical protein